jgi:predicted Zn-dependent peptidase
MSVSAPLFSIGIKDVAISSDPAVRAKKRAALSVLQNMLFDKSSPFFLSIYESGLLNGSLDYWYEHNEAFSLLCVSGESDDPEAIYCEFLSYIDSVRKEGLDEASFLRHKRAQYADVLDVFDSTESLANQFIAELFDGADLLDSAAYLDALTFTDVCELFASLFCEKAYAMSIIEPITEE